MNWRIKPFLGAEAPNKQTPIAWHAGPAQSAALRRGAILFIPRLLIAGFLVHRQGKVFPIFICKLVFQFIIFSSQTSRGKQAATKIAERRGRGYSPPAELGFDLSPCNIRPFTKCPFRAWLAFPFCRVLIFRVYVFTREVGTAYSSCLTEIRNRKEGGGRVKILWSVPCGSG